MALAAEDVEAISVLAHQSPQPRGAAIEALRLAQRRRGWVDESDLAKIAGLLAMTAAELDAVATFYNLIFRRPVGRHVLLVCDSVSCWMLGGEAVRARLEAWLGIRLGETTPDGRFTLLPIVCLGACDHAPALMVDEELHGDLDAATLDRLLERYR